MSALVGIECWSQQWKMRKVPQGQPDSPKFDHVRQGSFPCKFSHTAVTQDKFGDLNECLLFLSINSKEIEKIPAFMNEIPEDLDLESEDNSLIAALQAIKYDEDDPPEGTQIQVGFVQHSFGERGRNVVSPTRIFIHAASRCVLFGFLAIA